MVHADKCCCCAAAYGLVLRPAATSYKPVLKPTAAKNG